MGEEDGDMAPPLYVVKLETTHGAVTSQFCTCKNEFVWRSAKIEGEEIAYLWPFRDSRENGRFDLRSRDGDGARTQ